MSENLKKAALASVEENAAMYEQLSDTIWENPELSLKETASAALYCEKLRELGFRVEQGLCGIETAFSGSYGKGRPVIGILGEFDALSGLSQKAGVAEPEALVPGGCGHGCGHNLLGVGSLAAAVAVKRYLELSGTEGTVIFYGCPGEEGGSGKAFMARENKWRDLDAAFCWHPGDVNEVRTGTNNSSIQVLYHFKGVAAHAAGEPHQGRSALDAVELMNVGVQFLREHMTDDCRIHYSILDAGGVSPNVVQAHASVLYMVRANKVADSVKLLKRVDKIAEGAALMTETGVRRQFIDGTAELLPNFTLEKLLYENFEQIGIPEYTDEERAFAAALHKNYPAASCPPGIGPRFDAAIAKAGSRPDGEYDKAPERFPDAAVLRHRLYTGQYRRGRRELADAHRADHDGDLAGQHAGALLAGGSLRKKRLCPQGDAPGRKGSRGGGD